MPNTSKSPKELMDSLLQWLSVEGYSLEFFTAYKFIGSELNVRQGTLSRIAIRK